LKSLFTRAQNLEQEAINKLCGFYQSLIKKEAGRYYIYKALGEDAINIAWVIFLNFIQHYQGDDFKNLPGLIQYHLHYELLHQVQKEGRSWVKEIASEELMEMQAPEQLDQLLEKLAIRQELDNLSPHQRDVLEMYYHQNKTNEQIAKHFGCSISTIKRQKLEALTNLKTKLNH
jgi:RNA polymerase sigma factor (sigma-70 family)